MTRSSGRSLAESGNSSADRRGRFQGPSFANGRYCVRATKCNPLNNEIIASAASVFLIDHQPPTNKNSTNGPRATIYYKIAAMIELIKCSRQTFFGGCCYGGQKSWRVRPANV